MQLNFKIIITTLFGLNLLLILPQWRSEIELKTRAIPNDSKIEIETKETSEVVSQPKQFLKPEIDKLIAEKGGLYNPPRGDVRLLVISDLNSAYGSTDYDPEVKLGLDLIPFWQPDLVVCSGDMIAGQNPSLTVAEIRAMWAAFEEKIAQPLREAQMPFGFTIGNHDASSAVGFDRDKFLFQQERDLAREYWQKPEHNPGVKFIDRFEFPFYYTFEDKGIFFLVWDGSSSRIPPEKLAWVEKSLASKQAQQAKMRMIIGHLPLYAVSVGRDSPGEVLDNAQQLQQMLEKYDVHTYISGHQHSYYPGHRGDLQLLHTGILGSGPRPLIAGDAPAIKTITVVDINFDESELTTYTTYNMETFELILYQQLPRLLMGHNGMVLRRDIDVRDLTTTEKITCQNKLGPKLCQN
jgi:hypothetical protein